MSDAHTYIAPCSGEDEREVCYRPKKIIAVGLIEHMGDIVACEPVARHVRLKNPHAYIVWCVRSEYRELIDSHPSIDETYVVSCVTEWILLRESLIFDEIVDLHINHRYCPACKTPLEKTHGNLHVKDLTYYSYGSLLASFSLGAGLPALNDAPKVYVSDDVRHAVDSLNLPSRFIAVHAQSKERCRDWKKEQWDALSRKIADSIGLPLLEIGFTAVLNSAVNFCGRLSILETAEVIRRAELFVGIDSGPAHLANAVGTFGIILLGTYKVYKHYMPYSGEYADGTNAELLYAEGNVSAISVDDVFKAIERNIGAAVKDKAARVHLDSVLNHAPAQHTVDGKKARAIAFYLPQFHPIPENDAQWGKGFTEWTNAGMAAPLFPGHYQPHVPADLGYYDLRMPQARKAQAELARAHGIEGFCYWHYWFGNGKRLLELPFSEVLTSGEPDFPFCLAWANEPWTRQWNGTDTNVFQAQEYPGPEDDAAHFQLLLSAFRDRRYMTVDGKPVFCIYRPAHMPDVAGTIAAWRRMAKANGLNGLYLIAFKTVFEKEHIDWKTRGFDGELYHMPFFNDVFNRGEERRTSARDRMRKIPSQLVPAGLPGRVFDYTDAAASMKQRTDRSIKCEDEYATVVCGWDNSPRFGDRATILRNSSPEAYERWLNLEVERVAGRSPEKRLIFINAWNEWAEGMHLEPDQRFGTAFLEGTRRAVEGRALPLPKSSRENILSGAADVCRDDTTALLDDCWRLTKQGQYAVVEARMRPLLLHTIHNFAEQFHLYSYQQHQQGTAQAETTRLAQKAKTLLSRALSLKAELAIHHGTMVTAHQVLLMALNLDNDAVFISANNLLALGEKGFRDTSMTVAGTMLAQNPDDGELRHALAHLSGNAAAIGHAAPHETAASVAEALDIEKDIEEAERLIDAGETGKARTILTRLLTSHPAHIGALNDLAVLEIIDKNWQDAALSIRKVIVLDPSNEVALQNLSYLDRVISNSN